MLYYKCHTRKCTNQNSHHYTLLENCEKRLLVSSCPSICTGWFCSHLTDFHETWSSKVFKKNSTENSIFIIMSQSHLVLYTNSSIHFVSYLSQFFLEWKIFQTKVAMENETHILHSQFFLEWKIFQTKVAMENETHILHSIMFSPSPQKSYHLCDVEKWCRVEQATDDNMVHAHGMLDN